MKKLLITLALVASTANAGFMTGNDLYTRMQGDEADRTIAMAYVAGAFDAYQGVVHCAPQGVTLIQVRDMVRKHLEAEPTQRHVQADLHLAYVLGKTWPCPKKPTQGKAV